MQQNLSALRMFLSIAVLSVLVLGPTARPIVEPRAMVLAVLTCRDQVTGVVVVTASQGRTYTLGCSADRQTVFSPVRQAPAEDAPWQVTITVQPASLRVGLPLMCRSQITLAPSHVQCAAISAASSTVDLDLIWTFDFGNM